MKTIYIDIYFLINFTVDLLTLYFSASLSKIFTTQRRLLISSFLGGLYAVICVIFIDKSWVSIILSPLFIILMVIIITPGVGFYRRVKYCISFVLMQIIIGGLVYYSYCTLDNLLSGFDISSVGEVNKKLLILSVFVLLSICVLKVLLSFFTKVKSERSVEIEIACLGRLTRLTALVDSGNLVTDPFDKSPVMFVDSSTSKRMFSIDFTSFAEIDKLSYEMKKRMRPISVCSVGGERVIYAIKPDEAYIIYKGKKERIRLSVAIGETKSFSGYSALIPLSAVEDIF